MPLERRNTISAAPSQVTIPSKTHHNHSLSFGMSSTSTTTPSASYISIKEIIASSTSAPPHQLARTAISNGEIAIRNRLVKQAAWAYLQPMSTEESGDHLLCRLASMIINPIVSLFRSAAGAIASAFNCLNWF